MARRLEKQYGDDSTGLIGQEYPDSERVNLQESELALFCSHKSEIYNRQIHYIDQVLFFIALQFKLCFI